MSGIDYETGRYFEDVEVGEQLPELSMPLDWTTMALQVSGSQDWTPIHHDFDFAKESGMDSIFYNTGWTSGMLGRLLTDWAGREGWVRNMSFQMRGMNGNGVTVLAQASVTGKRIEHGQGLVDLDISLGNNQVGVTTPGKATVRLPLRQGDST
ncbi:MAG: hypothetical protein U5K56_20765 [Halioglobus sp.]|nr:hypothetical protein [Halioglobus sp.]